MPTDVEDPAAVERLVGETMTTYGRLDAAFNNAGGGRHLPTRLADVPVDAFDDVVRLNLRGVFVCMKFEIPAMAGGGGGAIVNMSSTAGDRGVPGLAGYVASKHGVIGLTRSAALDYAKQGIRINAVVPGQILTERLAALPEEGRRPIASGIPMQRMGAPEEVAAAVVWLCSDQASFVTGAAIATDGGKLCTGA